MHIVVFCTCQALRHTSLNDVMVNVSLIHVSKKQWFGCTMIWMYFSKNPLSLLNYWQHSCCRFSLKALILAVWPMLSYNGSWKLSQKSVCWTIFTHYPKSHYPLVWSSGAPVCRALVLSQTKHTHASFKRPLTFLRTVFFLQLSGVRSVSSLVKGARLAGGKKKPQRSGECLPPSFTLST